MAPRGNDLHVLVLPSWYHTHDKPYAGTFFVDWALSLKSVGLRVGVAFVEGRSLRSWRPSRFRGSHFQLTAEVEDDLPTVRLRGWNPLAQWTLGGMVWARLAQRAIAEYIRQYGRPDLVAAQAVCWAGLAAQIANRRWKIPYVITEVNTDFGTGSIRGVQAAVSKDVFNNAQGVVAISLNLRERLQAFAGLRAVEVIPCTVDDQYWTLPLSPRRAAPYTFYSQAHLVPRKGLDLLIRAFASRFAQDAGVQLVIGGGGAIRQSLESLAAQIGIASRVTFLGALPRDRVRQAMWEANCFVLPSLAENFGVVLIEALATGLPVISTRCGGPEDIITPSTGFLLEPGDELALGDAMEKMRTDREDREKVCRDLAVSRYSYPVVGRQMRNLFERVVSSP